MANAIQQPREKTSGQQAVGGTFVELAAVKKQFELGRRTVIVLNGIDLQVRQGDFVALLGKSGSGKSTLLNIVAGLDRLTLVGGLAKVLAGIQTQIVAASLKSTKEAVDAFLAGAQHITVPFDLLTSLSNHPLSVQTVEQFNAKGVGIRLKS